MHFRRYYTLFTFLFLSTICFTQIGLTAEERAYLFHIVRKSPILEQNIGRYFEYKGPDVRFFNKEINYDSVESIIINEPAVLFIRKEEIAKSPKGILAEAANKVALWELNKTLLAARQGEKEQEHFKLQLEVFQGILLKLLPESALKLNNGEQKINKKIWNLLNPTLSFEDKSGLLTSYNFLSENDQLNTIVALNTAVNQYVEARTKELFEILGGESDYFQNILVAAGDGSETSGLLNEREKDENGRWNKGLPKAIGFFPYQVKLGIPDKKKNTNIETNRCATLFLNTVGENKETKIHFDVWGYNSEKQTTVVIERRGTTYHLFGSGETRFLSPDSSFSKGKTFQSIINDLERTKIVPLKEKISGKKGFDFQIELAKKKRHETEVQIEKKEQNYSSMTRQTITTSKKAPRKVKKANRNANLDAGGKANYAQPKTNSNKKKRGKEQNDIVSLYQRYDYYTKLISDLEKEKIIAVEQLAEYQQKLDLYKQQIGYVWAPFTEKDGFYTFSDSTTFDSRTQEFTFRADSIKEPIEIRLLAIPFGPVTMEADEVMLHVNLIDAKPGYDARLQLDLQDAFASNDWKLNTRLIQEKDSVAVREFFEILLDKKIKFESVARGQGVGTWNGVQTVKSLNSEEIDSYGPNGKDDEYFKRLRRTYIKIDLNRTIELDISTFTDPVPTDLVPKNALILENYKKYQLTGNDYLSALRTATVIQKLKMELNVLAGSYMKREEAKIIIDRLNKNLDALRVSCGPTSFKWQDLLK